VRALTVRAWLEHMQRRTSLALGLATVLLAAGAVLSACSAPVAPAASSADVSFAEVEAMSATEAIDTLQAVPVADRATDYSASVRPDVLVLTAGDGREVDKPLPEDLFHLSVAPYEISTHECFFHNLTTCRGELAGQTFEVTVVDGAGTTILDETLVAADNGFVDFWLPRGIEATLTVRSAGEVAVSSIATGADDPTCLTDLKLSA
jgi:hypothetical protein